MRFLGLGFEEDAVPGFKTVWLLRKEYTRAGAIRSLFSALVASLKGKGYLAMSGQIIDAPSIAAAHQRNTDAEKTALKEDQPPEAWVAKPLRPAEMRQGRPMDIEESRGLLSEGGRHQGKGPDRRSVVRL